MKKQLTSLEVQDVLQKLEAYLGDLKSRWDQENPGNQSYFKLSNYYLISSTKFLVECLDELIIFVEDVIPNGSDKKQAVLTIASRMFDYIVVQAFPFWLKPFTSIIKEVIVNVIVSNLIDYIVNKYNSGYWQMKQEATNGEEGKVQ